jgi:hypothetical protein
MKLSSLFLAGLCTVGVLAVLLLVLGVNFQRPIPMQGAGLYNPANELVVKGVVAEVRDFACPVGEGEVGTHLMLKTADRVVQVHLAPGRIMRSQKIKYSPGDQIDVLGAKMRFRESTDLIAREITRGNETIVFRDSVGKLMLVQ